MVIVHPDSAYDDPGQPTYCLLYRIPIIALNIFDFPDTNATSEPEDFLRLCETD